MFLRLFWLYMMFFLWFSKKYFDSFVFIWIHLAVCFILFLTSLFTEAVSPQHKHCVCVCFLFKQVFISLKEMATHSSVLAWRIPGTGKPGRLPPLGSCSRIRLKRLSSSSSIYLLFLSVQTYLVGLILFLLVKNISDRFHILFTYC